MYPYLKIRLNAIRNNAGVVSRFCRGYGIETAGVVKFSDGAPEIARAYFEGGCRELCGSRVNQLKKIRTAVPEAKILMLRLPMPGEVADVVKWSDTSLNSSEETLRLLNEEAGRQKKQHAVILLLDAGDLREGVMTVEELVRLAVICEWELPHLYLRGVGSTFGCFGSVQPDRENLGVLVKAAEAVECEIGRMLETISGGSSNFLPPLRRGEVPARVNHVRVGGGIADPIGMRLLRDFALDGIDEETVLLHAQLIEVGEKPSVPFGRTKSINWKGDRKCFEDHGVCRRAIAAVGEADVGDVTKLLPADDGIRILGGSSDHLIFRIEDEAGEYRVGDVVTFRMLYSGLMHSYLSTSIEKRYCDDEDSEL